MSATQALGKVEIGEKFFKYRDYTPIPLVLVLLLVAEPRPALITLGVLLVVIGELIRLYSVAFIGPVSRTRKGTLGSSLVTGGPFAIVRNPLYVGNFFISFGVSVFGGSYQLMILTVLLFACQYYFVVKYEESLLRQKFGQEFSDYVRKVPAFIPTFPLRWQELEWPQSLLIALKSEKKTLMAIVAVLGVLLLAF